MPASPAYTVVRTTWREAQTALAAVRRTVFVDEQRVPEHLEWDEHDAAAVHVLALTPDGVPIGTGRLLPDGRIGRMAVLPAWRGRGAGAAMLRALLEAAHELGYPQMRLHAQTHALGFYAKCGFIAVGDEFMEAGIPHREMILPRQTR